MGAIGVDAGLKPDPGIADFRIWIAACNFQLHRIAPGHGNIHFTRARLDRVLDGIATHVCRGGPGPDQFNLGSGLVHPQFHSCRRNVFFGGWCQKLIQKRHLRNGQVIALKPNDLAPAGHRLDRAPVVVTLPIRVGDVVAISTAPGLCGINTRAEGDGLCRGDNLRVGPTKGTVKKARIIGDVVHGGQHTGVDARFGHLGAQFAYACRIFGIGKRKGLLTLVKAVMLRTFHQIVSRQTLSRKADRNLKSSLCHNDKARSRRSGW